MAFTLMGNEVLYKQSITKLPDYFNNGIMHEGEETFTYPTFSGWTEPMDGEEAQMLANGASSKDTRWLFTEENLNTYQDFESDSSKASLVYLSNPEEGRKKAVPYVVFDRQDWDVSSNFSLVNKSFDYIIIRQDKLK